jgi:hypothetical protein
MTPCEGAQGVRIFFAIDRRNNDRRLSDRVELGVHHDPRDSSVAIVERMYVSNEEHDEDRAREADRKLCIEVETLAQRAFDIFGGDERRVPCTVRSILELPGPYFGASLHQRAMTRFE